MEFWIVDVFAEEKYAGNQLAVVLDAAALSGEQMQTIALEMGFSETTFVLSREESEGGYDVRIFTPGEEVPFAGHPTLGTAWVLRNELPRGEASSITLNLKVGPIPVTVETNDGDEILWMLQNPPRFGRILPRERAAALLDIAPDDVDARFPAQEVSTGLPFLLVPLRGLSAVRRSRLNRDRYGELVRETGIKGVFLFGAETYRPENRINARMFADDLGVPEDPATGSANGCLAGYLVHHRYFGETSVDVRVEQGFEIRRPSLLRLRAAEKTGGIDVLVGGRVFPTARGELI
jgi:trans-2,3-dihydro-3-hydroxyanthranilate isomerase